MAKLFKIIIGSHQFTLTDIDYAGLTLIRGFLPRLVQTGLERVRGGRYKKVSLKTFATASSNKTYFRLHINILDEFYSYLKLSNVDVAAIKKEHVLITSGATIDIEMTGDKTPLDYQENILTYLLDTNPPTAKFVGLQTGKGKTFTALSAIARIKKRTMVVVKPKYLPMWTKEITANTNTQLDEIIVVQGLKNMKLLLEMARDGTLNHKFILIANKTFQIWIREYEKNEARFEKEYCCRPQDICQYLECGVKLVDEVHEDFHAYFKIDMYTNVKRSISLSATLFNKNPFLEKMYNMVYPMALRAPLPAIDKYIHATVLFYHLNTELRQLALRTVGGFYSHNAFESVIMRRKEWLGNYLNLIHHATKIVFFKDYKQGEKVFVFAQSIAMCTIITNYFTELYPSLTVGRFCEEDPEENLHNHDIVVTTILSGGTGHDVKGLKAVVLTIAIDSAQANAQTYGRLRKSLLYPSRFIYFACRDLPKHMAYHYGKKDLLDTYMKTNTTQHTTLTI